MTHGESSTKDLMSTSIETQDVGTDATLAQLILDELVSKGEFELPLLPETASKLLGICNDQNVPPSELADCIRQDQSIATHVLRMANSAMYMVGSPVVSLQQAVARLGIGKIREIVLIVSCQGRVFDVEGFADEVRQSFRNSLAAAVFAQEIARARRLNVEDAFLCGLLHDIGRPVLLQAAVDYQKSRNAQLVRDELLTAIESHRTRVGSSLIEAWKLPQRIADAVENQLDELASQAESTAKVLNLAIEMAHAFANSDDDLTADLFLEHPMVVELNLYPDELTSVLNRSVEVLELIGESA